MTIPKSDEMSLLVGVEKEFKPEVLLLVGNGAIKGQSWEPVKKAMDNFATDLFKKFSDRKNVFQNFASESLFLAQLSFFKRISTFQKKSSISELPRPLGRGNSLRNPL